MVHRDKLAKAFVGLSVALLLCTTIVLSKQNKKLSESLETAQNNIEAYQGSLKGSQQANNVLKLTVDDLQNYNDDLIHKLNSVKDKLNIKTKQLNTAATQTQLINVSGGKGVKEGIIQTVKDTIYKDSIMFNNETIVHYAIGTDTVGINLDISNTQYLYTYCDRHYKNKKPFLLRLLTFDFKKVNSYKYKIHNSNDLIHTDSVRVVEFINK